MKTVAARSALVLLLMLASVACQAQQSSLPESDHPTIGYARVAEALAALRAKPGAIVTNQGGWTIVEEKEQFAIWSFAPEGHPAYPAVVKRYLVKDAGHIVMKMSAHCEASKAACDDLMREFMALNEKVRAAVGGKEPTAGESPSR